MLTQAQRSGSQIKFALKKFAKQDTPAAITLKEKLKNAPDVVETTINYLEEVMMNEDEDELYNHLIYSICTNILRADITISQIIVFSQPPNP